MPSRDQLQDLSVVVKGDEVVAAFFEQGLHDLHHAFLVIQADRAASASLSA